MGNVDSAQKKIFQLSFDLTNCHLEMQESQKKLIPFTKDCSQFMDENAVFDVLRDGYDEECNKEIDNYLALEQSLKENYVPSKTCAEQTLAFFENNNKLKGNCYKVMGELMGDEAYKNLFTESILGSDPDLLCDKMMKELLSGIDTLKEEVTSLNRQCIVNKAFYDKSSNLSNICSALEERPGFYVCTLPNTDDKKFCNNILEEEKYNPDSLTINCSDSNPPVCESESSDSSGGDSTAEATQLICCSEADRFAGQAGYKRVCNGYQDKNTCIQQGDNNFCKWNCA